MNSCNLNRCAERRLKLLFEPPTFYAQLGPVPKRDAAVKQGLAYQQVGTRPYPPLSKRYDQIAAAMDIDETAALNSASWGLPQIMGFNHTARDFRARFWCLTSSNGWALFYASQRVIFPQHDRFISWDCTIAP